jgi:UDP-N-acetylglucosamine acyltransferase
MIHPTAIIHPQAKLDGTVTVGPYVVIDEAVTLGPHCVVGPYVYLTGATNIGAHNRFHAGCVIGDAPQDLKYQGDPTRLRIGDRNVFREQVTVQRANKLAEDTVIGSDNFLMVNSHVGHNCVIGDHVILANGVLVAGHVTVGDRAFLSGNCLAHQFVRIGTLALMQGGSAVSQDVPPYTVARGRNRICGLNVIGLRRAGLAPAERLELKRLYAQLFRSGKRREDALAQGRQDFKSKAAGILLDFVASAKRGVCPDYTRRGEGEPEVADD